MLATALLIAALVLLLLQSFNVPSGKVSLGWLGMACWVLSLLLGRL